VIDANIFNSSVRPAEDPAQMYNRLAQLAGLRQEQQIRAQQLKQGQVTQDADAADRAGQAKATVIGPDGKMSFNRDLYFGELARGAGSGRVIGQQGAFLKQDQETAKANLEKQKAELELRSKNAERIGQLAGSAVDEASWHRGIQQAISERLPGAEQYLNMPFDPGLAMQIQKQAVSAKEQIDQHLSMMQYNDKRPGVIADSNKAVKVEAGTGPTGITAEQQQQNATARRGQDISASTARRGQDLTNGAFSANIPQGVTGDMALMSMNPQMASTVKAIGDGKIDFATMTSRMPPGVKANLASAILAYKPDYDQRNFGVGNAAMVATAKSEVPKDIGTQKVAFNTAIDHADLLQKAAAALKNGDSQTLNGLKNKFKNEFGESGPITAQTIADAYTREVTSVLSKGHMTDSEIQNVGKTIDTNRQNFDQISSVIGAYKSLAQSKMDQLQKQEDSALKRTQTGGGNQGGADHHVIRVAGKNYQYNGSGDTADMKNYTEVR
jgi:hypothetical protein